MLYIYQGNVLKATICSQHTDDVWYEDITDRNITLIYEIADTLSMRYLAFAVSANNYEWEVLQVQDKQNNIPVNIMLPEAYSGSNLKFGVKLYDTPPAVGSVLHVGFDYVVTGGVTVSDTGKEVTMSCPTAGATIRYTLDGSDPTETSVEYIGAFNVTPPVTIKARGFKTAMNPSDITVKEIIINIVGYGSDTLGYDGFEIGCEYEE